MCKGTRVGQVKTVSAEELESNCLEMIDLVSEKGFIHVITKDGKPIAKMIPAPAQIEPLGKSRGSGTIL